MLAIAGMAVFSALILPFLGLYAPQRGVTWFEELRRLFNASLLSAVAWFTFLFLSKSGIEFSRVWSTYWIALMFLAQTASRGAIRLVLRRLRASGYNLRHIVIIGAGELGSNIVNRLNQTRWTGFKIHGFYDDNPDLRGRSLFGVPVLGPVDQVLTDLDDKRVDQVWLALPLRAEARIRDLLDRLSEYPVQVRFVPDIFNFTLLHHSMSEIAGLPVINLTDSPLQSTGLVLKNIEDVVLSALVMVITSPLLLLIAVGIKLSSPGPVLYRQERVTWNGEHFSMLKFRSMPVDAEATSGPVWATQGERRATPFGAFLRRTSMDELPQFINVLRGQMSIVGPRPERPEFVQRFKREIPATCKSISSRPASPDGRR